MAWLPSENKWNAPEGYTVTYSISSLIHVYLQQLSFTAHKPKLPLRDMMNHRIDTVDEDLYALYGNHVVKGSLTTQIVDCGLEVK